MSEKTPAYHLGRKPLIAARIPHLPASVALDLYAAENAPHALAHLLQTCPEILNAVFVASESLHRAALKWIASPCEDRVFTRLLMYVVRMSTRTTPFGTFATVSTVNADAAQTLSLADESSIRTRSRVDTGWLFEFVRHVERSDRYADEVLVAANDLVIERGERLYVMNPERVFRSGAALEYAPVSLRNTEGVRLIRSLAEKPVTLRRLREGLAQNFGDERERITAFLERMLESGILVSCLRPTLTEEPLAQVARAMEHMDESIAERLSTVRGMLSALDGVPAASQSIGAYQAIVRSVRDVFPSDLAVLQVDAKRELTGGLPERVCRDGALLAEYFVRLGSNGSPLDAYASRFIERYEGTDRLIPLLELVDPDFGLGAPTVNTSAAFSPKERAVRADLAARGMRENRNAIDLDDTELEALLGAPLSNGDIAAVEIGFHVLACDAAAIDRGEFVLFPGAFGVHSGAGCSLGRFGDMMAGDLFEHLNEPDEMNAELVFHPVMTRAGNVAVRPPVHDYEIQVGIHSQGHRAQRLDLRDLYVGMEGRQFFLYSQSHRRRVCVRETHVLNTPGLSAALPRFLALLQHRGIRQPRPFSWGDLSDLPALPRLQHKRIVLAPAQWNLPAAIVNGGSEQLCEFISRWNVPRYVYACQADNRLLVDLRSLHAAAVLKAAFKPDASNLRLLEAPVQEESWLAGPRGAHLCEFVASFHLDASVKKAVPAKRNAPVHVAARHGLNAEWTCFKIYSGSARADILLQSAVPELLSKLRAKSALESFFFVRYADPKPHLRLRIRNAPDQKAAVVRQMFAMLDTLLANGEVDDVAVSTYAPEVERYGGPEAMPLAETLFHLSSEETLRSMRHFETQTLRAASAVQTCLPMVHALLGPDKLADWCYQADSKGPLKLESDERAALRNLREFQMGEQFMTLRGRYAQLAGSYRQLEAAGNLGRPLFDVIEALVHMHFNRFGIGPGKPEERARGLLRAACLSTIHQLPASQPKGATASAK